MKRPYRDGLIPVGSFPDRRFGAHFNAEMDLIGSMLRSYGVEDTYINRQDVYMRSYEGQESFAEWQQRVWYPSQRRSQPAPTFTLEELAWLAEHFEGANDPMALAILAKVRRLAESTAASSPAPMSRSTP